MLLKVKLGEYYPRAERVHKYAWKYYVNVKQENMHFTAKLA